MSTTFLSERTTHYYEEQWIARQLKKKSKEKYWFLNEPHFGTPRPGFWSIVSDKKWSDISFHFELKWTEGIPMTEVSEINIVIHLETKEGKEEKYQKARKYFEERGYRFKPDTKEGAVQDSGGSDIKESITPDFSSEEAANKTIDEIIEILESDPYQACAQIINDFIRENP